MRRCFLDANSFIVSQLAIKNSYFEIFHHSLELCMQMRVVHLLVACGATSVHQENMP